VVLGEPRAHAGAAVVADEGDPLVAEVVQQRDDVVGHGPLVVAGGGLVGVAVAAQVRRDHGESPGRHRDLLASAVPGLGEAVQQMDRSGPARR
jgi:hypothetical protein